MLVYFLVKITRIGWATYKGSIELDLSHILYDDLKKGLDALCLNSYLHLIYLVCFRFIVLHVRVG